MLRAGNRANREAVCTVVVVLRVNILRIEVEVIRVVLRVRRCKPIVAVTADVVDTATTVVAVPCSCRF